METGLVGDNNLSKSGAWKHKVNILYQKTKKCSKTHRATCQKNKVSKRHPNEHAQLGQFDSQNE